MSKKNRFYVPCMQCGAMLRSEQRLENHQKYRCNNRHWPSKGRPVRREGQ